jgi:hypothetical protein
MSTLVSQPLGTTGNVVVSESAGTITVDLKEAFASYGIAAELSVSVSSVAVVTALAAATSNATLKAILTEAGALLAVLPA